MIANNIFRAIGNFFVNVFFRPFDAVRFSHNWWLQNTFNWILVIIAFIGLFYWLSELNKHKKAGGE
jgi:hypothetical protein